MERLNTVGFAVGFGAMWSVSILYIAWGAMYGMDAGGVIEFLAQVYPGYDVSYVGGLAGAFWGFMDGAIQGTIIAVVYNAVADTDGIEAETPNDAVVATE